MKLISSLGLFALLAVVGCKSAPSEDADNSGSALVGDIASMTQNADGTFEVTCKDGHVEHSVTTDAIHSDAVCQPRKPKYQCELEYYNSHSADSVVIDQRADFFDVFPSLNISLGVNMPYFASALSSPAAGTGTPSTTDGYFEMSITNAANDLNSFSQAEVALDHLGEAGHDSLEASYTQLAVPEFTYSGKPYNLVIAFCYLHAAPK
jgi:hypothetical protein